MTIKKKLLLAFSTLCLLLTAQLNVAAELKSPDIRSPLFSVRAKQTERLEDTLSQITIALDETQPIGSRVNSALSLGGVEYDYLLSNGGALLSSEAEVAKATVSIIGGEIAMLPSHSTHSDNGPAVEDEYSQYQVLLLNKSIDLLREALKHTSPDVRLEASAILLSRGDKLALGSIETMIESGEIPTREGIGYMTLAPSSDSAPFLKKYLSDSNVGAQAAAASYLAYDTKYVDAVREVVLSEDTSPSVIAASLPGLSRTDSKFLEYGVVLASNPKLDKSTREAAIVSTINVISITDLQRSNPNFAKTLIDPLKEAALATGSLKANMAYEQLIQ